MSSTSSPARLPSSPQQPLPVALVVPPELLLDIFTLVGGELPTHNYHDYCDRRRNLRALTLVHRKWTASAQELLRKEIWISIDRLDKGDGKKELEWKVSRETKYLGIQGNLSEFLRLTGLTSYPEPTHIYLHESDTVRIDCLAVFPNLQTLVVDTYYFVVRQFNQNLCFRNLRRLTIKNYAASETSQAAKNEALFKPKHMPNLCHLAWEYKRFPADGFDHDEFERMEAVMGGVDHQITTLALRCCGYDCGHSIVKRLPPIYYYSNLRHLAISDLGPATEARAMLFPDKGQVKLESLHLDVEPLSGAELVWLDNVRQGKNKNLVVERIVLYGKLEKRIHRRHPQFRLDQYECRVDENLAFDNFDGR